MPDIRRILDAMVSLAAAIPGTRHSTNISMHGCDAQLLQLLVDYGGERGRFENETGTEEWDCVDLQLGHLNVYAYGRHRPIVRVEVDPAAVEAALAKAHEVLS